MVEYRDYLSILSQDHLGSVLNLSSDYAADIFNVRKDTPDNLKELAHYALAWGIGDDGDRSDFISRASEIAKKNLKWVVNLREEELDEWLAGPEAAGSTFTAAYIAFSNMRMASDELIE